MRSQLSGDQGRKYSDRRPFFPSLDAHFLCVSKTLTCPVEYEATTAPSRAHRAVAGHLFSGQRPTGQGTVSEKRNKLCRCSSRLTWFPMPARRQPTAVSTESLVWSPLNAAPEAHSPGVSTIEPGTGGTSNTIIPCAAQSATFDGDYRSYHPVHERAFANLPWWAFLVPIRIYAVVTYKYVHRLTHRHQRCTPVRGASRRSKL